jgi:hypothetical protein
MPITNRQTEIALKQVAEGVDSLSAYIAQGGSSLGIIKGQLQLLLRRAEEIKGE